jgi:hypothetical protein
MKKHMYSDKFKKPLSFYVPKNANVLEYIINMIKNDIPVTAPPMITRRVWGFERAFSNINGGRLMQFIYEEYTIGRVGKDGWQHYFKNEYCVR